MANKDTATSTQQDRLAAAKISGNYHYCCDLDNYHYVKKTGYLIKSPSAGRIGRWRKRWFRLVDRVLPDSTGGPIREVRLEYFTENPQKLTAKVVPKMKGALDLRSCIAVVNHDGKIKGHSHVLNLVMSNLMVHHLVAHSEKDRDEWVSAMNEFLFKKQQLKTSYCTSSRKISTSSVYTDFVVSDDYSKTHVLGNTTMYYDQILNSTSSIEGAASSNSKSDGSVVPEDEDQQYDYIPVHRSNSFHFNKSHSRTVLDSESDSESEYWNDPRLISLEQDAYNQQHPDSLTSRSSCSLRRSKSSGELLSSKHSHTYMLKLPEMKHDALTSRWSMSSSEDDYNGSGSGNGDRSFVGGDDLPPPLVANTNSNKQRRRSEESITSLRRSYSTPLHLYYNVLGAPSPPDRSMDRDCASTDGDVDAAITGDQHDVIDTDAGEKDEGSNPLLAARRSNKDEVYRRLNRSYKVMGVLDETQDVAINRTASPVNTQGDKDEMSLNDSCTSNAYYNMQLKSFIRTLNRSEGQLPVVSTHGEEDEMSLNDSCSSNAYYNMQLKSFIRNHTQSEKIPSKSTALNSRSEVSHSNAPLNTLSSKSQVSSSDSYYSNTSSHAQSEVSEALYSNAEELCASTKSLEDSHYCNTEELYRPSGHETLPILALKTPAAGVGGSPTLQHKKPLPIVRKLRVEKQNSSPFPNSLSESDISSKPSPLISPLRSKFGNSPTPITSPLGRSKDGPSPSPVLKPVSSPPTWRTRNGFSSRVSPTPTPSPTTRERWTSPTSPTAKGCWMSPTPSPGPSPTGRSKNGPNSNGPSPRVSPIPSPGPSPSPTGRKNGPNSSGLSPRVSPIPSPGPSPSPSPTGRKNGPNSSSPSPGPTGRSKNGPNSSGPSPRASPIPSPGPSPSPTGRSKNGPNSSGPSPRASPTLSPGPSSSMKPRALSTTPRHFLVPITIVPNTTRGSSTMEKPTPPPKPFRRL